MVDLLKEMAERLGLPDLVFLVSLWDSYENPLFLENTHCPVFTICKRKGDRYGVLYPEFRFFSYRRRLFNDISWASDQSPWEQKEEKAFWRGMTSGGYYPELAWDLMPRARVVMFSQEQPALLDAAFTLAYDLEDKVKEHIEFYGLFQPWHYPVDFVKYKYLVSVDGNAVASNFWWQLLSNCMVLKSDSEKVEWFYKGLESGVHYLSYALDCSDFGEKVTWARLQDGEAQKIADQASAFAREHLSNEALVAYFYRVLLAYAELQR